MAIKVQQVQQMGRMGVLMHYNLNKSSEMDFKIIARKEYTLKMEVKAV